MREQTREQMAKYRDDAKQLYTFNLLHQKGYEVWFTSLRKGVIVNTEAGRLKKVN